ncbi:MAG: adenosylhomocysteinase, partial [Desulfurococcaceae archaeon]
MDMSFANQFLAVKYLLENKGKLPRTVMKLPRELDEEVARLKLESMGIEIDTLTPQQREYLSTWKYGT